MTNLPQVSGHEPLKFLGQKGEILEALRAARRRGEEISSFDLSRIALQYGARIYELKAEGFRIENRTFRRGRQVCGAFRLIAEPGEAVQPRLFEVR